MIVYNKRLLVRVGTVSFICSILGLAIIFINGSNKIGQEIDSYKGVPVYYNGKDYTENHGQNYSEDGYYYGRKWQCVEFVRRFYYQIKKHRMPDMFGNAKDYFDPAVAQGRLNHRRGLVQYRNGGNIKPQVDDILVFTDSKYGHVAIVTEVGNDFIELIQQNVQNQTRRKLPLLVENSHFYLGDRKQPAVWLRVE